MLDYGNFRYGYKILKDDTKTLAEKWNDYFPNDEKIIEGEEKLRTKPKPAGLIEIDPDDRYLLGYLASEEAREINKNRTKLKKFLKLATKKNIKDPRSMGAFAREEAIDLLRLTNGVAISTASYLLPENITAYTRQYDEIIKEIIKKCETVDEKKIKATQNKGIQNANTYLAMHDLDVYVATSMRDYLDFSTNWEFIKELFHKELKDLHLTYFDPTQKYLGDRIQEGLMECLMIMRASVTIYNAQESDTFGKDAELGVTLARSKPAIVYVARLFEKNEKMKEIYDLIDTGARQELAEFVDSTIEKGLLKKEERGEYVGPRKTKNNVIESLIKKRGKEIINRMSTDEIVGELVRKGYELPKRGKLLESEYKEMLIKTVIDSITKLENRALIFREIHPLSLQTSPADGVARGIIVTRDVHTTAEVLKKILTHSMKYEIEEEEKNWILRDEITNSPIRVVTKNFILSTAFWSEQVKYNKNKYSEIYAAMRRNLL